MAGQLASVSLADPGHMPAEYAYARDGKDHPVALSRTESHDRVAPMQLSSLKKTASLEEYMYWARIQREEEEEERRQGLRGKSSFSIYSDLYNKLRGRGAGSSHQNEKLATSDVGSDGVYEKNVASDSEHGAQPTAHASSPQYDGLNPEDVGQLRARRAMRLAGASSVFFLITTDILGPNAAPYAMSQTGYISGNILSFVLAAAAAGAAMLLMQLFCALDSTRYPVKTYSDLAERLLGKWARHVITFLQSVQLVINVGLICLTNGQSLEQLIATGNGTLCFAIAPLVFALLGMIVAQIRTLRGLSVFANLAVWMNIFIVISSMVVIKKYGLNYDTIAAQMNLTPPFDPVQTAGIVDNDLPTRVNSFMNFVFAYGGAMIFPEICSEMRRPMDFWKGVLIAQLFIYAVYTLYSNYFYTYAGQYSLPVAFQGMSAGGWLIACNVLNILTGITAAAIYGNVGIKVAYINIVEALNGPALYSNKGRLVWAPFACVYWALAYVIACAIPQVGTVSGLVAAVCILNFSYTFPFFLALVLLLMKDAMSADAPFVPGQPIQRADTWRSASRWRRAIFAGSWTNLAFKVFLLVLFLGSLTTSGLGMYGSGLSIQSAFAEGGATGTSFGCASTV